MTVYGVSVHAAIGLESGLGMGFSANMRFDIDSCLKVL